MQLPCALKVYLHALVNNADFPLYVTYLAIFISVQSTYNNILCKMADASKWIRMDEISKLQQTNNNNNKTTTIVCAAAATAALAAPAPPPLKFL